MLALERRRKILNLVRRDGSARVADLAQEFNITEETVRRDLDKLEDEGSILRSHGGAVPNWSETPHWLREVHNKREKRAIALKSLSLIVEGSRILLDASTTARYIARELDPMHLTVVTPSLYAAEVLAKKPGVEVILIGGTVSPVSSSTFGSEAEAMLDRYHLDAVFMSCTALDVEKGVFEATIEQAALRRSMLRASSKRHLLVDHSKFGTRSLARVAPVAQFDTIITDAATPADMCDALRKMKIAVLQAEGA